MERVLFTVIILGLMRPAASCTAYDLSDAGGDGCLCDHGVCDSVHKDQWCVCTVGCRDGDKPRCPPYTGSGYSSNDSSRSIGSCGASAVVCTYKAYDHSFKLIRTPPPPPLLPTPPLPTPTRTVALVPCAEAPCVVYGRSGSTCQCASTCAENSTTAACDPTPPPNATQYGYSVTVSEPSDLHVQSRAPTCPWSRSRFVCTYQSVLERDQVVINHGPVMSYPYSVVRWRSIQSSNRAFSYTVTIGTERRVDTASFNGSEKETYTASSYSTSDTWRRSVTDHFEIGGGIDLGFFFLGGSYGTSEESYYESIATSNSMNSIRKKISSAFVQALSVTTARKEERAVTCDGGVFNRLWVEEMKVYPNARSWRSDTPGYIVTSDNSLCLNVLEAPQCPFVYCAEFVACQECSEELRALLGKPTATPAVTPSH